MNDIQELAIELLNAVKKFFKFKELERLLNIPIPTIWRYIHRAMKPSVERAQEIISTLLREDVISSIMSRVIELDKGIVKIYDAVYNIDVLTIASIDAYLWARSLEPTAVMTVETDGIPLATLVAKRLGTKLVVVKKRKEIGVKHFYEVSFVARDPPEIVTLYLPTDVLAPGSRVLIVDDLIRSGRTTRALIELVEMARSSVVGVYALIGVGDSWIENLKDLVGDRYRVLFRIK